MVKTCVNLSIAEKVKLLDRYDKLPKMSERKACQELGIPRSSFKNLLRNRAEISHSTLKNDNLGRKRKRAGNHDNIDKAVRIWFEDARGKNASVSGPIIMEKAEEIARTMGIEDFTPSQGWFFRWKKRENIVFRKLHGEEKSADTVGAENWIRNEWPKIVGRKF